MCSGVLIIGTDNNSVLLAEYRAFFDDFLTDNNLKWCV